MNAAVSFDHVCKRYRGEHEYRALRDDLAAVLSGRRRPTGSISALEDVSFEIPEGQAFALIGRNGAGKTTALKIATRIAYPTAGLVRVRGRVGALIEVGTGLHPELTGRENVQLYGRVLGLSRRDVERRFDEIVEFSGIGSAVDRPVKQFSSGMQLRLGFSLAAHLEPDVLLVDEAIAVGDAGFQYRCVERMSEVVREGRTLVFVSHDMSAVETLCERAILLDNGRIVRDAPARDVVREYLLQLQAERLSNGGERTIAGEQLEIVRVSLHDATGNEVSEAVSGEPLTVRLHYRAQHEITAPIFSVGIGDGRFGCFSLASMLVDGTMPEYIVGAGYVECTFDDVPLQPQTYELWGSVRGEAGFGDLLDWQRLLLFRVKGDVVGMGPSAVTHSLAYAPVRIPYRWSFSDGARNGDGRAND